MKKRLLCCLVLMAALLLAIGCNPGTRAPELKGGPERVLIAADAGESAGGLDHAWEEMTGSGNARLYLKEGWSARTLAHLKDARENLGMKTVRFHGIFGDEVGLYQGPGKYDFSGVDRVYDGVLAAGVLPFVELSFMPKELASNGARGFPLGYRPFIAPPKSYEEWGKMIEAFTRHLVERYGLAEVKTWYFEVWNEPNLSVFWSGNMEDYWRLYDLTARTIKAVSPELQVGGPSSSGVGGGWIYEFLKHCAETNAPLDFLSTHGYYANDDFATLKKIADKNFPGAPALTGRHYYDQMRLIHFLLDKFSRPELPVFITEWGSNVVYSYSLPLGVGPNEHDLPNDAAFMPKAIKEVNGYTAGFSHWTYSDVFEEWGLPGEHWPIKTAAFHGGFGLITIDGIHKPSYHAFAFLHRMGKNLIKTESQSDKVDALITLDGGRFSAIVWYWLDTAIKREQGGREAAVSLEVKNLPAVLDGKTIYAFRIDQDHGNPFPEWIKMGKPGNLSPEQVRRLQDQSDGTLRAPDLDQKISGPVLKLGISLAPGSVVFLTTESPN